ncbi:MAG: FAD-dependent thymidylate synthase [Anaerolineaceae bacterium]|nr:FAD-dependent thymidylate synthase [Anaerolineaceae bacterium]
MSHPRRIYLLSPKAYSPETIAVTFAKTSRSPQPFDEIAAELNDDRSAKFHEKWVVGYGHSSVAEHAVLHLALENVSRLAIETIEGNRLASYTEKSTRYQQWDDDAFYVPQELDDHPLSREFIETCKLLFSTYRTCIPKVQDWLRETMPRDEDETEKAYARRLAPASVDICRFLLPAASLANVGVTINARALEYGICKMLSSPLAEVQQIGEQVREAGQKETPTLIKYADCNRYLVQTRKAMHEKGRQIPAGSSETNFRLWSYDPDGENAILAAVLFRFNGDRDYEDCLNYVSQLNPTEKSSLVDSLLGERGRFDQPLRELEYAQMTFEIEMDQGAYFESKRHRMMTQTAQPLTASLGFAIPRGMVGSGCEANYLDAMRQAGRLYEKLAAWNPEVAGYIVPNGFNRRVLLTMNLRQAFHFCQLRAAENAHFSIRLVALKMWEALSQVYPTLTKYMRIPEEDSWQNVQEIHFSSLKTA